MNEVIYEDLDAMDSTRGRSKLPTAFQQQPKPALPSRNSRSQQQCDASILRRAGLHQVGSATGIKKKEQVYEELDVNGSGEWSTVDNAAYISNMPPREAWQTTGERSFLLPECILS